MKKNRAFWICVLMAALTAIVGIYDNGDITYSLLFVFAAVMLGSEKPGEILRFAQNDREGTQNDREGAQNDRGKRNVRKRK